MTQHLLVILYLASVTTSITVTLSRAALFKTPREWVAMKSPFLGKLLSCPYCMSHWVTFLVLVPYRPTVLPVNGIVNYFAVAFATITVATLLIGVVFASFQHIPPPDVEEETESEIAS